MIDTLPRQKRAGGSVVSRRRAWGGMLVRKERWTLTLPARLIILLVLIGGAVIGVRYMHPFLAITSPTKGQVLVVEAWIPRYGLEQAVEVYKAGGYQKMIASACPRMDDLTGRSSLSTAEAATMQLERYGMSPGSVTAVPCQVERKDRTYNTALAVKQWFEKSGMPVTSIDVVTIGPHARRSRLLFQKAFGDKVKIGVIAIEDRGYDPEHWWESSEGVREVIGEGIAYIYARVFFHPSGKAQ